MKKRIEIKRWVNWYPGSETDGGCSYIDKQDAEEEASGPNAIQVELTGYVEVEVPKPSYEAVMEALEKAKAYIDHTPCDPDIYPEQIEAWREYQEAVKEIFGESK